MSFRNLIYFHNLFEIFAALLTENYYYSISKTVNKKRKVIGYKTSRERNKD